MSAGKRVKTLFEVIHPLFFDVPSVAFSACRIVNSRNCLRALFFFFRVKSLKKPIISFSKKLPGAVASRK